MPPHYPAFTISASRSPMITQGAIVLPVVMCGMTEPSAMRRFWMPGTRSFASTTHILSLPIFAVQVAWKYDTAAST